ncbi:hypothetical protein ACFS2C_10975 [Prauserella oleivorans]|uniref:Uncharacterized protein n=1 Tax=Prauserella oleivorans TaxID=1478153 RepID=A0ABW5WC67_9PSEU
MPADGLRALARAVVVAQREQPEHGLVPLRLLRSRDDQERPGSPRQDSAGSPGPWTVQAGLTASTSPVSESP